MAPSKSGSKKQKMLTVVLPLSAFDATGSVTIVLSKKGVSPKIDDRPVPKEVLKDKVAPAPVASAVAQPRTKADKNRERNKRRREAIKAAKQALKATISPAKTTIEPVIVSEPCYGSSKRILSRSERQGLKAGLSRLRDTLLSFLKPGRERANDLERVCRLDFDKLISNIESSRSDYSEVSPCRSLCVGVLRRLAGAVGDQIVACKLARKNNTSKSVDSTRSNLLYEKAIKDFVVGCMEAEELTDLAKFYDRADKYRKSVADTKRSAAKTEAKARRALIKSTAASMRASTRK